MGTYRQQPEDGGAADGGEEPAPVVAHGEVHGGDLDAEEDAAHGRREAAAHPHGAGGGEHLGGAALVLVDALEAGDELTEQGGGDAGDVDKGAFFTEGHAAAEGGRETHYFGHEGAESQIFLEGDPAENSFHFGDART